MTGGCWLAGSPAYPDLKLELLGQRQPGEPLVVNVYMTGAARARSAALGDNAGDGVVDSNLHQRLAISTLNLVAVAVILHEHDLDHGQ